MPQANCATNPTNEPRFENLGLSEQVLSAVQAMGYRQPTPIQAAAIPHILTGCDVLAAAQTGTGKTAAFLLPTLDRLGHVGCSRGTQGRSSARSSRGRGPLMLVITPTRELAQQIEYVCRSVAQRTGHVALTVVGGVSYNPQRSALARGCDVLVATPGRLCDLIDQGAAQLSEVGVLVLDEADRMLEMGFLPQVRKIVAQCRSERQTLLFSATLDESRVGAITDLVHNPARIEIAPVTSTADTVDQYVLSVTRDQKNAALIALLKKEGTQRVIVFVRTKRRADTAQRRLTRAGIACAAIHGDKSQAQRERALRDFRNQRVDVLVATDVLARGIDVSNVSYVVNFDVPADPTDYIHRIGRTGRAGDTGWALTFVTHDDIQEFFAIEALMGKTATLYQPQGIEVGENAPQIDPARVPQHATTSQRKKSRRPQRSPRNQKAPAAPQEKAHGSRAPQAQGSKTHRSTPAPQAQGSKTHRSTPVPQAQGAKPQSARVRHKRPGTMDAPNKAMASERKRSRGAESAREQTRPGWRNFDEAQPMRSRAGRGQRVHSGGSVVSPERRRTARRRPGDHGGPA